jgi:hypothetical protein
MRCQQCYTFAVYGAGQLVVQGRVLHDSHGFRKMSRVFVELEHFVTTTTIRPHHRPLDAGNPLRRTFQESLSIVVSTLGIQHKESGSRLSRGADERRTYSLSRSGAKKVSQSWRYSCQIQYRRNTHTGLGSSK